MDNKEKFIQWMINNSERSKSTISKYSSAISTISKELKKYYGDNIDIYKVIDSFEIDNIKEKYLYVDDFRKKDERGNRMYTCSLNWYKKYLEEYSISNTLVKDNSEEYSIIYEKKAKGEFTISEGIKQWKRDRKVVDRSIELSNHKCEYDDKHEYLFYLCNQSATENSVIVASIN